MKIYLLTVIACTLLLTACKKNNGGGSTTAPPPTGGKAKRWFVKDVMTQDGLGKINHRIFEYNDTGLIVKIDYGLSANVSHPEDYGITASYTPSYDVSGKLLSIKYSQGPGSQFVYVSNFSLQVESLPFDAAHQGYSVFNFNLHGNKELDDFVAIAAPGPKTGLNYTSTRSFYYNPAGGIQSASATNYQGTAEDQWAALSTNGIPVANCFSNGMSIEQHLIYYLYSSVGEWDLLGPSWSNGTIESYSYASGTKAIKSHFFNEYTIDSNKNVIKIVTSYSIDSPAFNSWVKLSPVNITYEQH